MIRTILVDDEILARLGLRSFLDSKKDIQVIDEFDNGEDALDYLRKNAGTDIVITDIEMIGMNGLELIRSISDEHLAGGIIIVSCHPDFRYAKEAMEAGAGAYLLKQEISEEQLTSSIREVYKKSTKSIAREIGRGIDIPKDSAQMDQSIYAVGVIQFKGSYSETESPVDENMLENLMSNIVKRHQIGTLFVPYKRDMFILFQFNDYLTDNDIKKRIEGLAEDLAGNVRIYVNRKIVLGVSPVFRTIKSTREEYDRAEEAASLSFYKGTGVCRFYERITPEKIPLPEFTTDGFLDEDGDTCFGRELENYLDRCRFEKQPVDVMKKTLIMSVMQFIFRVLQEYRFPEEINKKWNNELSIMKDIDESEDIVQLKDRLLEVISEFRSVLLTHLKTNEFEIVLQYIKNHLDRKMSLQELADMSYMSTSAFCKRFRQETGKTMVQYINEYKVESVKSLLRENRTLEEIADKTGFLNVNYMIRVFKKVEGKTITEYRESIKSS